MDVLYSSPACDGHRQGLEWVGAGGMRCCFLHANAFGKRSGMDDHEDVLITCPEPARFALQDHDTLYDRLVAMRFLAQKLFSNSSAAM